MEKLTRKQALNLGSNPKRKWVKEHVSDYAIKQVNPKGYAYLKVSESDKLINRYFDKQNGHSEPESKPEQPKQQQKQPKKVLAKSGNTDKQVQELTTLLSSLLQSQETQIDEDAVREIVKQEVAKQATGVQRIKAEFETRETPEIKTTRKNVKYMLADLAAGNNTWLAGPTGSGKTVLAYDLAKALGVPEDNIYLVSCEPFTFKSAFWGGYKSANGDYVQGAFEKAAQDTVNGEPACVILDEITKLDPEIAGTLNAPLAHTKDRKQFFTNGKGEKMEMTDVYIIATSNTFGKGFDAQYVGNQQQDLSLLNRFNSATYYVDYDRELEKSLVDADVFARLDKIRDKMLQHQIRHSITLRDMVNIDLAKQAGKPLEKSVECLTISWTDDERAKVGL